MASIDDFLIECCTKSLNGRTEADALWSAYKQWCDRTQQRQETQHSFGRELSKLFTKGRTGTGRVCYFCIELSAQEIANDKRDDKQYPQDGMIKLINQVLDEREKRQPTFTLQRDAISNWLDVLYRARESSDPDTLKSAVDDVIDQMSELVF